MFFLNNFLFLLTYTWFIKFIIIRNNFVIDYDPKKKN